MKVRSIKSIVWRTYSLILIAVILLSASSFSIVYIFKEKERQIYENVIPRKKLLNDYRFVVTDFERLWNNANDFFNANGLKKRNEFSGLVDVVLPNLNRKIYKSSENLDANNTFYLNNKSIVFNGEELLRGASKLLRAQELKSSNRQEIQDVLSELKSLILLQNSYLELYENQLVERMDEQVDFVIFVSVILTLISIGIVIQTLRVKIRRVIKPIEKLTSELSQFSELDYGKEFIIGDLKEFLELSKAFNQMSSDLKLNFDLISESNDQLSRLTDQLQASKEETEEFNYIISHDLKAPVRGIKNLVLFIKEDFGEGMDEDLKDFINKIESSALKMDKLIQGVLEYSKASFVSSEAGVINLEEMLVDIVQFLGLDSREDVKVTIENMPAIKGDEPKIKSVFTNLFTNAVKYNRSELKEVSVSFFEGMLLFSDNGIGIPEKDHEAVFGFFKRLHSNEFEGTGAGMAIAKRILDRHNIPVMIQSEEGKGTSFMLDLTHVLASEI